jgi:hypothetical protein
MKIAKNFYTILCDDIRHEVGNKLSYMGVYNEVRFAKLPSALPKLALGVTLLGVNTEIHSFKFYLELPNQNRKEGGGNFPQLPPKGTDVSLDLHLGPLKIDTVGIGKWVVVFNDSEDLQVVHKFKIVHDEPPVK